MSRILRTIFLLWTAIACSDAERSDRDDDDDDRPQVQTPAIVDWLEDIAPIVAANRALRAQYDALFLAIDCSEGPASEDENLAAEVGCNDANETEEELQSADRVIIALTEQILPAARDIAVSLAAIEVDEEEDQIRLIHSVLLAHWQDRVTDLDVLVDAWNREDTDALTAAFAERMRSRRSMGIWLEETNTVLAEQGVQLEL